ncbi:MAG TPA: PBP1A family penicillin-binding protein [Patescibacteria group bacterium]|nr:PBP1A family penicillin-binding protein [Patescibacteria group bacterium]
MRIIMAVLNFIVNLLVRIGDFVLDMFYLPVKATKSAVPSVKNITKPRSGTFNLKKKEPIKLPKIKVKSPIPLVSSFFLKVFQVVKKAFLIVVKILKLPFVFIAFVFGFIVGGIKKIHLPRFKKPSITLSARTSTSRKMAVKKPIKKAKFTYHKPSFTYKLKYVFIGFMFSFVFLFMPLVSFLFVSDLPNPSDLSVNYIPKTTKIYDRNGTLLYEIYANQNRTIVSLNDIPKNLTNATVAIEDKDFYNHPGFDIRGIIRALITNVRNQGFQGGSTITQQLIKSAFLTPDPTIVRKVKEIALAFWAERVYSKNQILELYLNYVPYGGTAWGAQAASDVYFGKDVKDLDLAQSAFLAGLPQSPSVYSPFSGNKDLWKQRQREVLNAMVKSNYITKDQAKKAYDEKLTFNTPDVSIKAPHFVMYVRRLLEEKYGLTEVERGGLSVYTSLDLGVQNKAEQIVSDEVDSDSYLNIGNGAALITDPRNGDILAMVGSKNYFDTANDGNVNLTTSLRQPGSSIKLITYSLALSQGYTEASIMDDTPLTISVAGGPSYSPVNYDGNFHGKVPLRTAFANSFNIPPVRLAQKFGADKVKDFGVKMGISSWTNVQNYGVSITLGGVEVKMTDLATAYGVIANSGQRVDLNPILKVQDSHGQTIYSKSINETPILDPGVAFIISDILADNNARSIEFGLNTPLNVPGARVSVKTGTTDNKRDNWTIGFTPNVVVATWVGNNDNSPLNPALASGITGAAPMWNKIMTMMLDKIGTPSAVVIPGDVVKKYCLGQDRYFVQGTENSVSCSGPATSTTPTPQR